MSASITPPLVRACLERTVTRSASLLAAACVAGSTVPAQAQADPSGIDFVTVGAVNNPAYSGPDSNNLVTGRGSVPYEYKIGRTEVTTAQWMEFFNAFYGRAPGVGLPIRWGAVDQGGTESPRFRLSSSTDAGMLPVSGVTWRTSAMFCNWLHNDKSNDLSAIQNGAYDISTFGYGGPNGAIFTDQAAHNPGARYWIPTLDEWIKGSYYDPNFGGTGVGGWWWNTPAGTNVPLVHGPPGVGQSNSDFDLANGGHYRIPLGAYPGTLSPWGLLDVAGATQEMLESIRTTDGIPERMQIGAHWTADDLGTDYIYRIGDDFPSLSSIYVGCRLAAAVPSPSAWLGLLIGTSWHVCQARKRS